MAGAVTTSTAASGGGSPTRLSLPARAALQVALLLGAVIMLSPFVVMLVVSLVPTQAFLTRNFSPANFSPANYIETFEQVPFGRYYLNSIIVTVTVTICPDPDRVAGGLCLCPAALSGA